MQTPYVGQVLGAAVLMSFLSKTSPLFSTTTMTRAESKPASACPAEQANFWRCPWASRTPAPRINPKHRHDLAAERAPALSGMSHEDTDSAFVHLVQLA